MAELAEESANGTPIIVEGKKDLDALRAADITGPVLTLKTGGKTFTDALREIENTGATEVILFMDFDRRGKENTRRLKQDLEHAGVSPNLKFWQALSALLQREIQCIESLTSCMENLRKRADVTV